jgi:hypothetical protein
MIILSSRFIVVFYISTTFISHSPPVTPLFLFLFYYFNCFITLSIIDYPLLLIMFGAFITTIMGRRHPSADASDDDDASDDSRVTNSDSVADNEDVTDDSDSDADNEDSDEEEGRVSDEEEEGQVSDEEDDVTADDSPPYSLLLESGSSGAGNGSSDSISAGAHNSIIAVCNSLLTTVGEEEEKEDAREMDLETLIDMAKQERLSLYSITPPPLIDEDEKKSSRRCGSFPYAASKTTISEFGAAGFNEFVSRTAKNVAPIIDQAGQFVAFCYEKLKKQNV